MARRDNILRGVFLHTLKDGKINWQGEVTRHNAESAVVQLFSWLDGRATELKVIPLTDIHDETKCRMYGSREEWLLAADKQDSKPEPKEPKGMSLTASDYDTDGRVQYVKIRVPAGKTFDEAITWLRKLHPMECKDAGQQPLAVHIQWWPKSNAFALLWDFENDPGRKAK